MNPATSTEIERKYIIGMPDTALLRAQKDYTESTILQTYLAAPEGTTHRIRSRTKNGKTTYTETVKLRLDAISCRETEGEISKERYEALFAKKAPGTRTLRKTRMTFRLGAQIYEIDLYPEWKSTAILETELASREGSAEIPAFLSVIREVTGDPAYSNARMAVKMPQESEVADGAL